jgi:imidazoleglycerol phosphate dehydratase HisB
MVCRKHQSLNCLIDQSEEDHLKVRHLTEEIAVTAGRAPGDPTGISRFELAGSLDELETHLLEQLAVRGALSRLAAQHLGAVAGVPRRRTRT